MRISLFFRALCIAVAAGCLTLPAIAQSTFGTILGTVTDSSGAVVPNIVVKITNQGENINREVQTDSQGNYQAENIKEGIYTVSVKAEGFREVTVKDIRLATRQVARVDLKLVIGSNTENVTVEANAELINTESQTISASVTSTEVLGLPANYRGAGSTSPYNMLLITSGSRGIVAIVRVWTG